MPAEDQNKRRNAELVMWKSLCKTMSFEIPSQTDAHFSMSRKKWFLNIPCTFLFEKMEFNILFLMSVKVFNAQTI